MAMLLVRELQTEDVFEKVRHDEGVANAAAHMIRSISSRTAAVMKGFGQSRNEGNKEEARGGNSTGPASNTARHDLFEECLVMCEVSF